MTLFIVVVMVVLIVVNVLLTNVVLDDVGRCVLVLLAAPRIRRCDLIAEVVCKV
jgi:hypothetical protein